MCADILSHTVEQKLVSHLETPESLFNRYRVAARQLPSVDAEAM